MGKRDWGFKLGDALSPDQRRRLQASLPAVQVASIHAGEDPRVIASHLLQGELDVREVPSGLLGDVLAAVGSIHQAVLSRNEETIRSLRDALKGSNAVSRDRDGAQASLQAEIDRHRRSAQELGRTNLALREEMDGLREREATAMRGLAEARQRIIELEDQVRELTAIQMGTAEGAMLRRFLELASTELPAWLGRRDLLLDRARRYTTELDQKVAEADGILLDLKAAIENAQEARMDRAFAQDESSWAKYLVCCDVIRTHQRIHAALVAELELLASRRRECADAYEQIKRDGDALRHGIHAFVHTFHLIGVDIWERSGLSSGILERFELPAEVILLMVQAIPVRPLDPVYVQLMDELFAHVLVAPQKRPRAQTAPAPKPPVVQFFPGSIFLVEPEREVERLTCLILASAHEAGVKRPLFPDEIAMLILRASLCADPKRELTTRVATACQQLLARGIVSRQMREVELMKNRLPAFHARIPHGIQEARLIFTQVAGGQGDELKKKIARLFAGDHAEG